MRLWPIKCFLSAVVGCMVIIAPADSYAQMAECATADEPEPQQGGGGSNCTLSSGYKPDQSNGFQNTPCLVFKVNYHFLRPSDGSGPYVGDMSTMVNTEMNSLNGYYDELLVPALPVVPPAEHIVDSRVRFVLTGIYYHDDDARHDHYFNLNSHPNCGSALRDEFGVDQDRVINIFFYRYANAGTRYGCGPSSIMTVNMINLMPTFDTGTLAHELGHIIGLNHTFSCWSTGTTCSDDGISDTYAPDCNHRAEGCGPDVAWLNTFSACPLLTGVGISNNIMGYNSCRRYLSPLQLAKIHHRNITTVAKRMYVLCEPHSFNPPITVSNSAIWETSKVINADIEVEAGAILDVRCTLYMSPHAKIIVKPHGKLIVDGGTLTAHSGGCTTFWAGIEVWGNSNQHQFPIDHPTHQGLVVLKNGATIEHAREAIRLWKPHDWGSMGGVVQVKGTHGQPGALFLNCRRSVEFMKYQNFQPGSIPTVLRPNHSSFMYADFRVDDDYRGGHDFEAHVTMWAVDGVVFRACNFENAQTTGPDSWQLGEGIFSIDANYSVGANCTVLLPYGTPCPPENLDRGSFVGLGHGIDARNSGSGRGFAAGSLDFANNVVGIYAEGLPGFTANRNNFIIGDRDVEMVGEVDYNFQEHHHRGISTQKCHGFRIEENEFERANNVLALGVDAIVVENSGSNSTEVYKNTARNLNNGYIGEGNCMDWSQASFVGHQFLCNENFENEQNFWARKDDGDTWNHSIRTQQGSASLPAGNTFDHNNFEGDYKNGTDWVINYWHNGGTQEPIGITTGWLAPAYTALRNRCASRMDGKEVRLTAGLTEEVQGEFEAAKAAYINTNYVFKSLLDGGSTDAVVTAVQESWPQEAWDLRGYLLNKSPYLSTTVLMEVMKKNTLPQAMVLEICLANPEATKKESFVKWAELEAPSPLPGYMIDLIAGSWDEKAFRMELEAQIGQHHADMSVASDLLQASYRADEETVPLDAMLAQWNAMPNFGARYAEVEMHLGMQQFAQARTILQGLADRYGMKGREVERDRALWYIDQLEGLANEGRSIMQLTTSELSTWTTFAKLSTDIPGTWVRSVLCFGYQICLPHGAGTGGGNKSLRPRKEQSAMENARVLEVMPNPATTWATFRYDLGKEPVAAQVRITDTRGREVALLGATTQQGQLLWDTRLVPAGVYHVELFQASERIAIERLVVQPAQ